MSIALRPDGLGYGLTSVLCLFISKYRVDISPGLGLKGEMLKPLVPWLHLLFDRLEEAVQIGQRCIYVCTQTHVSCAAVTTI